MTEQTVAVKRKATNRSPSHPSFSLEEAIERARKFYEHERFNQAPPQVAIGDLGYAATSSSGLRALAALLHFGLLEEEGVGGERRVRLSELGKAILLDTREDSREREEAIKAAALMPRIYQALWERWRGNLPSDSNMRYEIVKEFGFNPDSVRAFIKDFRATVEFAKLGEPARLGEAESARGSIRPTGTVTGRTLGEAYPVLPQMWESAVSSPRSQERPVSSGTASAYWDFTVPVTGGQALVRIPRPLSEDDYDLVKGMIEVALEKAKRVITGAPTPPRPTVEPPSDDDEIP